ncbi:phosphatase PAP2 family protein [Pseudonocardiaceae bacterium YIM PH 21723]|nr:phosphatase PAP2 family protein [Pseudonocardiaceae bacterium YIM PH 21723]
MVRPVGKQVLRAGILCGAFVAVYLIAVWTPWGQRTENSLIRGYQDQAYIYALNDSIGVPPLSAEFLTIGVGLVGIAVVAAVRRQWRAGGVSLGCVVLSIGAVEVLAKYVLPRPGLVDAEQNLVATSFPSGHVAIAAALVLGAFLVAADRVRPYVVVVGAPWLAITAAGVQALCWHRPSDVLGATLLVCAVFSLGMTLLPARRGIPVLPTLGLAVLGAVPAALREDWLTGPLVFAAAAWGCAVLLLVTARR